MGSTGTASESETGVEAMVVSKNSKPESEAERPVQGSDEVVKNTLKIIQDQARQLEYATSKCSTVESLFGSELISRRNKLKNTCEQFIFESPKANCVPARDKLWRYVYYEAISKAKRLKQRDRWTPLEKAYVKQHLLNGIGQLSLLMLKLQRTVDEFKGLKLRICANGLDNVLPPSLAGNNMGSQEASDDQEWAADLLRLFMLNIGDLCRYLTDLHAKEDQELYLNYYDRAQDYYTQAFLLNPESGLAHNQLGNLSIKRNSGLDSIYYFLYSLVTKTPCQGALANLRQLLESQLVSFATMSGEFVYKPIHTFSHNFINMLNQFFSVTPSPITKFEKLCEDTVGSYVLLLAEGVESLDEGFLYRVISICMMTVWHLLASNSTATPSAVCLAVGMFVHSVKRLCNILKSHSQLKEVTEALFEEEYSSSVDDGAEQGESLSKSTSSSLPPDAKDQDQTSTVELVVEEDQDDTTETGFRKKRLLKKRWRQSDDYYAFIHEDNDDDWNDNTSESRGSASSVHSDYSDSESEEDSTDEDYENEIEDDFLEEGEQSKPLRRRVDSSEVSDMSYQTEIEIERKAAALKLSQSSDDVVSEFEKAPKLKLKEVVDASALLECWNDLEPLIVAVLPFMRWLQSWPPIQHALAASTEKEVMEEFCQLFNLLESTNWSVVLREDFKNFSGIGESGSIAAVKEVEGKLLRDWKNVVDGKLDENVFSLELPEDLSMLGWNHLIPSSSVQTKCTTKKHQMVTRIGRLLVFGQWLVGTEAFAVIRSEKTFLVPSVEEYKRHMRKIQMEKFSRRLTNRKTAPFSGGDNKENNYGKGNGKYNNPRRRRRRQDKIRTWENFRVNQDDKIYVVFDLSAVLKYLRVIQKMSRHAKFNIVLPFSVSRALDILKDGDEEGSKVARIANRWLERNANASYKSSIQLLKKEDTVSLENVQHPSIQTKESREFFEMLEACNYIRELVKNKRQRSNGKFFKDARDNYRILYLTGSKILLDSSLDPDRGFNPIATCRAACKSDVYLDRVSRYQNRSRNRNKSLSNGHCGG